jgi:hypothetical protein
MWREIPSRYAICEHYSEFDPIEPVEFERGDRGEAEGEFRSGRRYPMVRIFQFLR